MAKRTRKRNKTVTLPPPLLRNTSPPTAWDRGAAGKANRIGLIEEDAMDIDPATGKASNPNGVKRARRVDMLEVWHRQGTISTAGFNAAERLRDAYEATLRAPGWPESERVQSSPKPDHAVAMQIKRMSGFIEQSSNVAAGDKAIIATCVLDRGTPASIRAYRNDGYKAGLVHLREALDRMALSMESRQPKRTTS